MLPLIEVKKLRVKNVYRQVCVSCCVCKKVEYVRPTKHSFDECWDIFCNSIILYFQEQTSYGRYYYMNSHHEANQMFLVRSWMHTLNGHQMTSSICEWYQVTLDNLPLISTWSLAEYPQDGTRRSSHDDGHRSSYGQTIHGMDCT